MNNRKLSTSSGACYKKLISSYRYNWPHKNFLSDIANQFDQSDFLEALKKFKNYIDIYSHPYKCVKTKLLFESSYVSYSEEFKQLNNEINVLLNVTEFSHYCSLTFEAMQSCMNVIFQLINQNPMTTTSSLFYLFGVVAAHAKYDPASNNFNDVLDDLSASGIIFESITELTCAGRMKGGTQAKLCNIGQDIFYIKEVHRPHVSKNNPLGSIHHQKIAKMIEIETPCLRFFHTAKDNHDYYYLASAEVKNFKPASSYPNHVLNKIFSFENNMARLVVAKTLIGDLHPRNYGFSDDKKLVIVDLDMPIVINIGQKKNQILADCLRNGAKKIYPISPPEYMPALSKMDIENMLQIYTKMLQRSFPSTTMFFDFSPENYKSLVTHYVTICTKLLQDLNDPVTDQKLKNEVFAHYRDHYVNHHLMRRIYKVANELEMAPTPDELKFPIGCSPSKII